MNAPTPASKKKGGRKPLPPDQRRSLRFEVWLSPVERAEVVARAKLVGITPGEYMRRAITGAPMPLPPPPALNRQAWTELARLAANANQYQAAVNAGKAFGWRPALLPELIRQIRALRRGLLGLDADEDCLVPVEGAHD
jgi:hypothetical protein